MDVDAADVGDDMGGEFIGDSVAAPSSSTGGVCSKNLTNRARLMHLLMSFSENPEGCFDVVTVDDIRFMIEMIFDRWIRNGPNPHDVKACMNLFGLHYGTLITKDDGIFSRLRSHFSSVRR